MPYTDINPITKCDYPDPDVIRVGDVYYMVSTTMYFMPGGAFLRSYDLANWELVSYIFDSLDDTPNERLENELTNYAGGMWAPSLRYHDGKFYVAPTGSVLMQSDTKEVFTSRQMKTTNLTTKKVVDKWNIRVFFNVTDTDASQIVKYKVYVLDNYYSPNKVMSVYEGSVWAPHMGMERVTVSNINDDDDINQSIKTSMGSDASKWYDCIQYTHY